MLEIKGDNTLKQWTDLVHDKLAYWFKIWEVQSFSQMEGVSFGILISIQCKQYGDCVAKLIPPQIGRYHYEKESYKNLSSSIMCKLFLYDDSINLLLLPNMGCCINNNTPTEYIKSFFNKVYQNRCIYKENTEYQDLEKILHNKQYHVSNIPVIIANYLKKAIYLYDSTFKNEKKYIIHGDLHRHNMLIRDGEIYAIDPIGYKAPIEFELVRFIGTELESNYRQNDQELIECVLYWNRYMQKYCKHIIPALYIDTVFRLHNSTFEINQGRLRDKWLRILEIFNTNDNYNNEWRTYIRELEDTIHLSSQ